MLLNTDQLLKDDSSYAVVQGWDYAPSDLVECYMTADTEKVAVCQFEARYIKYWSDVYSE